MANAKAKIAALHAQGDFGGHFDVLKVTKSKIQRLQGKWKIQIGNYRTGKYNSKYFCSNGKRPFMGEMGKISAVGLRDVEKLYHMEDEAEITQKELAYLEKRKIAAKKEERGKLPKIQETEEKRRKN